MVVIDKGLRMPAWPSYLLAHEVSNGVFGLPSVCFSALMPVRRWIPWRGEVHTQAQRQAQ